MILSLLLVEDDPIEASRLESALTRLGYAVRHAADGDAALALASQTTFDVVLLDLVLPELDGRGVLDALAARGLELPVVVQVTAAGLDAAAGALKAGARDFVVKPAGALRLQVALANAIALHRAARPAQTIRQEPVAPVAPAAPGAADNVIAIGRTASAAGATYARLDVAGHARRLEQIEAEAIRFACHLYGGRLTEAARHLGIGRSTLYRKIAAIEDAAAVDGNRAMEPFGIRIVAAE